MRKLQATDIPVEALEFLKNVILEEPNPTPKRIEELKRQLTEEFKLPRFPKNSEILAVATDIEKKELQDVLRTHRVRTLSGVAVIAVMTAPFPCPHGRCVYCPGGPSWGTPQSYTGKEPASMRALANDFDPVKQVRARIRQLEDTGHVVDKIDVIVMGGTFNSTPQSYQQSFILGVYEGLNGETSETIEEAQRKNEVAKYRAIGLTIETRPDYLTQAKVLDLLRFGTTRVEVGVQTLDDDILLRTKRDHTVQDTITAFKNLRDAGLKITAHMMPGLPGSSVEKDIEDFRVLYNDPRFIPDEIKIYPTQVIQNTPLARLMEKGKYTPLTEEETFKIMLEAKLLTPPFVRIKRALRDLPATFVVGGPKKSNMRELVQRYMDNHGLKCKCIRCREVGHQARRYGKTVEQDHVKLVTREYMAAGAKEVFYSFEDVKNDILIGFIRLRLLNDTYVPELNGHAVVRELHVYGQTIPIGAKTNKAYQHKGYGRRLLETAELRAQNEGYTAISVISGVGVREYYRKLGYKRNGYYMTKYLEK